MTQLATFTAAHAPALIAAAGDRFLEFFAGQIRNPNSRRVYLRATGRFLAWLEAQGVPSIAAVTSLHVADSIRNHYRRRLDRDLDAIMALGPTSQHGQRLRKRYGRVRGDLLTFLIHPDVPPDNNSSERELWPTVTYRRVTGGFRSDWCTDLFASVRSVVGTAARNGIDTYAAICDTLGGKQTTAPG